MEKRFYWSAWFIIFVFKECSKSKEGGGCQPVGPISTAIDQPAIPAKPRLCSTIPFPALVPEILLKRE
jgi:hypothetical protein